MTTAIAEAPVRARISLTLLKDQEREAFGGFSDPSKMPWFAYSIPAEACHIGAKLRLVEGSVCFDCYAFEGRYRFSNVKAALGLRLEFLSDLASWTDAIASALVERARRFKPAPENPWPAFRWHDSGDIQSVEHLEAINAVAYRTMEVVLADGTEADVRHWLPTREYGMVETFFGRGNLLAPNLNVRLSAHMVDGEPPLALAKRYGLTVSTVHSHGFAYDSASSCPAYTQGGKCLSCRSCWNRNVEHVSYPAH